jgi:hypothetical protein
MKQFFSLLLSLAFLSRQAQDNILLDPLFWKGNPDEAAVKAAIQKGSNPTEMNREYGPRSACHQQPRTSRIN